MTKAVKFRFYAILYLSYALLIPYNLIVWSRIFDLSLSDHEANLLCALLGAIATLVVGAGAVWAGVRAYSASMLQITVQNHNKLLLKLAYTKAIKAAVQQIRGSAVSNIHTIEEDKSANKSVRIPNSLITIPEFFNLYDWKAQANLSAECISRLHKLVRLLHRIEKIAEKGNAKNRLFHDELKVLNKVHGSLIKGRARYDDKLLELFAKTISLSNSLEDGCKLHIRYLNYALRKTRNLLI